MSDTTAKIRAKGLDTTGITEEVAAEMFTRVGSHYMAIVDLQVVDRHGPDVKGKRGVELVIDTIEPALDDQLAEHLRELNRTLYYNRGLHGHTGTTTEGAERTVEDVLSSGAKHRPHPFLPVDAADDNPICDVCGNIEAAAVHSTQDALPDGETDELDDADELADGDEPDEVDPYDHVHTTDGAAPGADTACGLRATFGKSLNTHRDHAHVDCPECLSALDATWNDDDDTPDDAEQVPDDRVVQFSGKPTPVTT